MGRHVVAGTMLAGAIAMQSTFDKGAGAFVCGPLSQQLGGTRLERPRGSLAGRQPLPLGPRLLSGQARKRGVRMDAGEDLEQLDAIPGMPQTIGVGPVFNATSLNNPLHNVEPLLWASSTHNLPGTINSILPTRGAFGIGMPQTLLPEYSVEPTGPDAAAAAAAAAATATDAADIATRDHAASVAEKIAQKIARRGDEAPLPTGGFPGPAVVEDTGGVDSNDPVFRAAALKSITTHVVGVEKKAAARPKDAPARIDANRVPNLWLAVAHSSSLKPGQVKKVEVDGVPIALWRSATGEVSALADVCIHRGASLSRGWVGTDRLVCPYHGFEFESDGRLAHMPGAGPPTGSVAAEKARQRAAAAGPSCNKPGSGGRRAPSYPVKEAGGWIHVFPDETRPGAIEQHTQPLVIPEATSPNFRAVFGSMDISGGVDACVENMLDMLHISFVHSFGNMQDPTPFEVSYAEGFDDPGTEALATSQVTFRYRSGSRSFSKVVGGAQEVVVKNEFHLPYRAVIRVFFGKESLKTIEATAVPIADGKSTIHWKLYRNFAITHPLDEGPINQAGDFLFRTMMNLTLREDKDIVENIYPEYQKGFMNARYDKQMLQYRKAMARFRDIAAERANMHVESSLQMELLNRIASSQRGLATSSTDRAAILNLIERLESVQQQQQRTTEGEKKSTALSSATDFARKNAAGGKAKVKAVAGQAHASSFAAAAAASAALGGGSGVHAGEKGVLSSEQGAGRDHEKEEEEELDHNHELEGQWHLEYISNGHGEAVAEGWDFEGATEPEKTERVAALKEAGGEARLFDWNEKGRPLWADTSESVQIINTKERTLTNRAVYKGWSGFTTVVQLDACIEPLKEKANRLMVGFHKAMVNVGGIKVTFPHLQRFSPTGWLETTYVNQGIRIARGNKGSIFVLTRYPVSSSVLFDDKRERSP